MEAPRRLDGTTLRGQVRCRANARAARPLHDTHGVASDTPHAEIPVTHKSCATNVPQHRRSAARRHPFANAIRRDRCQFSPLTHAHRMRYPVPDVASVAERAIKTLTEDPRAQGSGAPQREGPATHEMNSRQAPPVHARDLIDPPSSLTNARNSGCVAENLTPAVEHILQLPPPFKQRKNDA